jgi:selenocysteine lyase/cysteine desulfurase
MPERNMPLTPEEIEHLRSDTPGCANVAHFNHAGASLMPVPVVDAVISHLLLEAECGGYEAADAAEARSEAVYTSTAALIGAKPGEIALIENATRAWDMAFYSIPFEPGDRILTSVAEYASNVIAFLQMRERGVTVDVVPNDESGQMSVSALAERLDGSVKLVAVSHMPTNGGLVQPAAEIGRLAKANGSLYLLDACQTIGQLPLDVRHIDCDFLSATSRKYLRGPRGAGFLYVRDELAQTLTPPFLDLHAARWVGAGEHELVADAKRFENWERNVAGLLGMGAAIDYGMAIGLDRIWATIQQRAASLRERLGRIPGVQVRDTGQVQGGIVTFDVSGVGPDEIQARLKDRSINVRTSSVFSTRYDMEQRGLEKVVRASVHYITSNDEITRFAEAIGGIAESATSLSASLI